MSTKDHDLIVTLLTEVRTEQKSQSIILTEVQLDLAEHKEGVILNRTEIKEHRAKIEELEAPREAFKLLKKYVIGFAALTTAVVVILKAFNYL